jgi:hypothetical protein
MTHVRTLLSHSSKIFTALVAAALIFTWTTAAEADHQPADKVTASGSTIEVLRPEAPVAVLSSEFRTSSPTDLMLHVTMECSILTSVTTPGSDEPGAVSTGEAEGRIRVWLTFDSDDPEVNIVPINSFSDNPQPDNPSSPGSDIDKVTFCNRHNRNTLTDMEDPLDGVDELEVYLNTKHANAFNWMYLNTGNGIHTIRVWAQYDEPTTATPGSRADGYVGNRTLIVEPTKMSNHASV